MCLYILFDLGAKNVINACRECRVKRLIYNSSADVVFDGLHDIHNGDESLACPWKVWLYERTFSLYLDVLRLKKKVST